MFLRSQSTKNVTEVKKYRNQYRITVEKVIRKLFRQYRFYYLFKKRELFDVFI